jgi:hypothetical protein
MGNSIVQWRIPLKLHLMPHKLVLWYERGLLGNSKPTNQLFANVWEPGNGL